MSTTVDLWPDDILAPETRVVPVGIMRDQALALGKRTNNVLEGEVLTRIDDKRQQRRSRSEDEEPTIAHSFYVKAPALDNYRYELFRVIHEIADLYPLNILFYSVREGSRSTKVGDESEFLQQIKTILSSDETKRIINSLLQQSLSTQGVDYDAEQS